MRLIVPTALTLVSSTATASTFSEWAVGTAYAIGANVKVTTAVPHHEYRALTANTGQAPATHPADWLDLGVTNPYRILSDAVTSRTMGTTAFTLKVTAPATCSYLALLNLVGVQSVTVRILTGTGGGYETDDGWDFAASKTASHVRSSNLLSTQRAQNLSWTDWFLTRPYYATNLSFNLPVWLLPGNVLEITVTGASGAAVGVGHLVLGKPIVLGQTQYGARVGIVDYSRRETDEWGNIQLVPRAYAPTWSADLNVPPHMLDQTTHTLAQVRATPCVYDGNPDEEEAIYDSLIVYGFYKQFSVLLADQNIVTCTLEVEGLT